MKEQAASLPDPAGKVSTDERLATEWSVECKKNVDCPSEHGCYPYYLQWDDEPNQFNNGYMCLEEMSECDEDPNKIFALEDTENKSSR